MARCISVSGSRLFQCHTLFEPSAFTASNARLADLASCRIENTGRCRRNRRPNTAEIPARDHWLQIDVPPPLARRTDLAVDSGVGMRHTVVAVYRVTETLGRTDRLPALSHVEDGIGLHRRRCNALVGEGQAGDLLLVYAQWRVRLSP